MNAATRSRKWTSLGGSSKSIVLSALEILEDRGCSLAAADAHGDHAVARTSPPHLAEKLHGELCAGRSERMAERDRAAVHVDTLLVHTELPHHRESLRAERLVQLDEIDLVEGQSGQLQRLRNRRHRTHAHDLRGNAAHREGNETRHRRQTQFDGAVARHDDHRRRTVRGLTGVPGRDYSLGMKHRAKLRQWSRRRVGAPSFIGIYCRALTRALAGSVRID